MKPLTNKLQQGLMRVEKRRHSRARVNWPVTIQTEEGSIERVAYDISPNGTFIRGLYPLKQQEIVDMTVSALDSPITVRARVVWSKSHVTPEDDMPRGMGVEFIKIADEDRKFISSFVSGPDFALYLESAIPGEDEERLIGEGVVEEKKENKNEPAQGPPQKCPRGHKHLSWSYDEDHLFCWDCNTWYPLHECFRLPEITPALERNQRKRLTNSLDPG